MKLRKKDFEVPKILSVPRWGFSISYRGNWIFMGMKLEFLPHETRVSSV